MGSLTVADVVILSDLSSSHCVEVQWTEGIEELLKNQYSTTQVAIATVTNCTLDINSAINVYVRSMKERNLESFF